MNESSIASSSGALSSGVITFGTPDIPKARISTRVVQTKAGHVGQVLVGDRIVWESKPAVFMPGSYAFGWAPGGTRPRSRDEAESFARQRVEDVLAKLFGDDS